MRTSHVVTARILLRGWIAVLALAGVQVSQAQTTAVAPSGFQNFMGVVTGNNTTVGFSSSGVALATRAQSGLPTGSGWTQAGNFGMATAATNIAVASQVDVPLAMGKTATITAGSAIEKGALGKAFKAAVQAGGALLGGPLGLALLAAPAIIDWMANSKIRVASSGDHFEHRLDAYLCTGAVYPANPYAGNGNVVTTTYCVPTGPGSTNMKFGYSHSSNSLGWPGVTFPCGDYTCKSGYVEMAGGTIAGTVNSAWTPATLDDVQGYMSAPSAVPSPQAVTELQKTGVPIDLNKPTLSGCPASVTGPVTTTTDSSGKSTITTTTYTITCSGDNIGYGTQQATKTTNPDGTTSTSTVTGTNPNDQPDLCQKYPDSVGCTKLDVPTGTIPKVNKNLTYTEETPLAGGGSCPADKTMTTSSGKTIKVWDWQASCAQIVTYVKPVVLAAAAFIALVILIPAGI